VEHGLDDLQPGGGTSVALLTGRMMAPLIETRVVPGLAACGWRPRVVEVENRLFGASVTCAGLLGGRDLLEAARAVPADLVLYPQETLNIEGRFLDDLTREELAAALDAPALPSRTLVEELNDYRSALPALAR
jgi:NifB/MoaA-like Fe-S oxidoreductase